MYCFAKLCRLCTKNINIASTLHTSDADEIQLKDKLLSFMPELVPLDEKLPSHVCTTCHERLRDAYDFKMQCLQSLDVLTGYLTQMQNVTVDETQVQQVAEIIICKDETDTFSNIKSESEYVSISTTVKQESLMQSNEHVSLEYKPNVCEVYEDATLITNTNLSFSEESNNSKENSDFVKHKFDIFDNDTVSLDTDIFKKYEATEQAKQSDACDEEMNHTVSIKICDETDTTNLEVERTEPIIEQVKNGTAPEETLPNKFDDEEYVNEEDASNLVKEITEPIFTKVYNDDSAASHDDVEATRGTNEHVDEPVVDKENARQLRRRKASRAVVQSTDDDSIDEDEAMDDFDYSSSGSEFQMCSDDASDDCDDPDDGSNMSTTSVSSTKSIVPRTEEINKCTDSSQKCLNNAPSVTTTETNTNKNLSFNILRKILQNPNTTVHESEITEILDDEPQVSTPEDLSDEDEKVVLINEDGTSKNLETTQKAIRDPEDPNTFVLQHPIDPDTKYVFIRDFKMDLFLCKTCNLQVGDFRGLKRHMARHVYPKNYACKICNKKYSFRGIKSHMIVHKTDRPFACKLCKNKFKCKYSLHTHMKRHNKKFCCEHCSALFSNSSHLKRHIANKHNHERNFICSICGDAFKTAERLKKHTLAHGKSHEYVCNICNKVLSTKKGLKHHKRYLHSDSADWEYTCKICNKKFKKKVQLENHIRLHTGEKPHVCEHCGKAFRMKLACTNHVRTHTGHRPFVCQVCDRGFTQATSLAVHMRTHTGEKPYKCKECGKCYTQSYVYYQHVKKKHPKTEGSKETSDKEQDSDQSSSS